MIEVREPATGSGDVVALDDVALDDVAAVRARSARGGHRIARRTHGRAQRREPLSPRERDVVRALARGRTNAVIAAEMFVSLSTVKTHVGNVQAKLSARKPRGDRGVGVGARPGRLRSRTPTGAVRGVRSQTPPAAPGGAVPNLIAGGLPAYPGPGTS